MSNQISRNVEEFGEILGKKKNFPSKKNDAISRRQVDLATLDQ